MRHLALFLFFVIASTAVAEERSERFALKQGSMICDTLTQAVNAIEANNPFSEGCGVTTKFLWAEMVTEALYQAHNAHYRIVRYEFPFMINGQIELLIQYGFWGDPTPIAPEPAKEDA